MHYSFTSVAAFLAFASSVSAQTPGYNVLTSPLKDQNVVAGKPFEIVWTPGNFTTGTASIVLLQGKTPQTLDVGATVTSNVNNAAGKFSWNVPTTLPVHETYGFRITHNDDASTPADESTIFQFSFPFHITGLAGGSATNTNSSGTTTVHLTPGPSYTPPANTSSTTTSSSAIVTPVSNLTTTSLTTVRTPTTVSSTPTRAATAAATSSSAAAAVANIVSGGLAVFGGAVLAFAL